MLLLAGGYAGLSCQHRLWDVTEPIRFHFDIQNAYQQGWRAQQLGVFNVYCSAAEHANTRSDGELDYDIDYPPLRLVAVWLWTRWTAQHFDPAAGWQNTWEFHSPLLTMNRVLLAMAAISAMGLVIHFARVQDLPARPPPGRGAIRGVIAGLLVWFCVPANLIGFAWPQWDICVPAFFLAALLAGCRRWWILSGILLATGGMYKGQLLVMLPIFLLWPLFAGEWRGLLRLCLGFAAAAGVIATPFMFQETLWRIGALAGIILAAIGLGILRRRGVSRLWWLLIIAAGAAAWPASAMMSPKAAILTVGITAMFFFIASLLPRVDLPSLIAAAIASAIWLPACLTPTPWYWLHVGLLYGTHHFPAMIMGPANSFPAILAARFGISRPDLPAFTIHGYTITWMLLLRTIFATGMVFCGIAMAIHYRRNNARFLLAAVTPWILFATIPAQIHERYLMYPALTSAVLVALGARWLLVHFSLTAIGAATVMLALLASGQPIAFLPQPDGPSLGARLFQIVHPMHPDIAWAMLTLCGVCLLCALDLRRPATAPDHPLPAS